LRGGPGKSVAISRLAGKTSPVRSGGGNSGKNGGLFITLEGIEGCGKSTQAARLAAHLDRSSDLEVVTTREPGGTDATKQIRALLADPNSDWDPRAELLLFLADRAEHVSRVIQPALGRGAIVLCDRYADSTTAYQGYGRGHDLNRLYELNAWASLETVPDLTLWIDCDIETGVRRAAKLTGGPGDRFENEPLDFHRKIHQGFTQLAADHPDRIVRIDGDADIDAVFEAILAAVEEKLGKIG
jgi:dTMP kinase